MNTCLGPHHTLLVLYLLQSQAGSADIVQLSHRLHPFLAGTSFGFQMLGILGL